MIYILENEYTKKLYNSMKTAACLITPSELIALKTDAILVIDEIDLQYINDLNLNIKKVIVLGEMRGIGFEAFTYISKYQSYKNIYKLIFDSYFPVTIATSLKSVEISPESIKSIAASLESDYIISLNYSHSRVFSLYDCLKDEQYPFIKGEIYEIMTNFIDFMKPPMEDIVKLIQQIQKKGSLLIVITPLKGILDLALIKQANALIWIDDSSNNSLNQDLKRINPHLQIQNLTNNR